MFESVIAWSLVIGVLLLVWLGVGVAALLLRSIWRDKDGPL